MDVNNLLLTEISKYKSEFDNAINDSRVSEVENIQDQRDVLESELESKIQSFDRFYNEEMLKLKKHVKKEIASLKHVNREKHVEFIREKNTKMHQTTEYLMNKVYGIRGELDIYDDYLKSQELEQNVLKSNGMIFLRNLLAGNDREQEITFLNQVLNSMLGKVPSTEVELYMTLTYALLMQTYSNSLARSNLLSNTIISSFDVYTKAVDKHDLEIQKLFSVEPLNRTRSSGYAKKYTDDDIRSFVITTLANKRKEELPYIPPIPSETMKYIPAPTDGLDSVLDSLHTYSSKEGIEILCERSYPGLLLTYNQESQTYCCDLDKIFEGVYTKSADYLRPCGYMEMDQNMKITKVCIDDETFIAGDDDSKHKLLFDRLLVSLNIMSQWPLHAGLCHFEISDNWMFSFIKHVHNQRLLALIKVLTNSVPFINDLATLVLINGLDCNITSTISNLPAKSIINLTKTFDSNYLMWPKMKERLGPKNTPLKQSLDEWWNTIHDFISEYTNNIDLTCTDDWLRDIQQTDPVDALSLMFFNLIIHELVSNKQILKDAIFNKIFFAIRSNGQIPCAAVHLKAVETLIATAGDTLRFTDTYFIDIFEDQHSKNIAMKFQERLHSMKLPLQTLSPDQIETSIAW